MRRRCVAVALSVVAVELVLSVAAGAGPPASCFRHKPRCDLTYYDAAQTLKRQVIQKLGPRLTGAWGGEVACGPTKHHSPGFARCTITIEQAGLPAPCTVEALFYRKKTITPFRVLWWKESEGCRA